VLSGLRDRTTGHNAEPTDSKYPVVFVSATWDQTLAHVSRFFKIIIFIKFVYQVISLCYDDIRCLEQIPNILSNKAKENKITFSGIKKKLGVDFENLPVRQSLA